MGVTVYVPKSLPREARGPPGGPAQNRCPGKPGNGRRDGVGQRGMGRDHPQGVELM